MRHQALRKGSTDTRWKNSDENFTAIVIMHDARCNPTSEAQKNNNELQKFNHQWFNLSIRNFSS